MNERTISALEWERIKSHIESLAACSLGKERIRTMAPLCDVDAVEAELDFVDDAVGVLFRHGRVPFGGISDVRPLVHKASIGGTLSAGDLLRVADFINGGRRARQFVEHLQETLALRRLWDRMSPLFDARQTELEIRQTVDEDGAVMDGASAELRRLRTERRQLENRARQVLESMLRSHQKYLQDPVIAMRGSSLCLPVRVEYKNQIPGVVHDYSASGATVFIEPRAAMEANLRVRELLLEEEREIEKILQRVSGVVAQVAPELSENADILADVDAWFAKAAYAKASASERPLIRRDGVWHLRRARHPLLDDGAVVPIDIELGHDFRLLIVTGPNTGGKTVALKTLGLLTIMALSGCFIPAGANSEVAWCDNIYVDIGDEQSIEQSLSTFSAHMTHIIQMLGAVTDQSLVLLDELGAGTDPMEGAALAIAILDELKYTGCRVMATTHHTELKGYAFHDSAAINASVEFDVETLRPTYRLQIGVPGRSNAIAIASRLGLHESIADRARSFIAHGDTRVDELIGRMETSQRAADAARSEAEAALQEAHRLRVEWEGKARALELDLAKLKAAAADETKRMLDASAREAARIIDELRRMQRMGAAKDHELVDLRKQLEALYPRHVDQPRRAADGPWSVAPGAVVKVTSLGQSGEVIEVDQDAVVVQLGLLRTKVDRGDVEVVRQSGQKQQHVAVRRGLPQDVRLSLDVRGETVDDATVQIDRYLDDATVNGVARVTIIHGKGTGALRDGVRRYLSRHPQVKSWVPGGAGEGGDGVTVVSLR